jgi:UDP-sugar transporter A1/2/3
MAELSAPVFQVMYQMKIITTALFSVYMLSRQITLMQWGAILALTLGVAAVQLSQHTSDGEGGKASSMMGLVYVLCGCMTSGFAGVYFEMVLKNSKASIWLRNIQLSCIGILVACLGCIYRDGPRISAEGLFSGYDNTVWGVISIQAAGGLIVAIVVKYADNVMKSFATSVSIIIRCVMCMSISYQCICACFRRLLTPPSPPNRTHTHTHTHKHHAARQRLCTCSRTYP